jgi:peptidoglycan hydrolase-like protein with peptidoglycan-binding domain
VYYCSSCGEAGDGRYCRMCGTALSPITDPAQPEQLASVAATQVLGGGIGAEFDGLFRSNDNTGWAPNDQTRVLPTPGVDTDYRADYRMAPPGPGYLPPYAPTAVVPQQPPQQIPVDAYRPPPDGRDGNWDQDDDDAPRKGIIYGTLGAVAVALVIIGALLYFGTPNAASNSDTAGGQSSASAQASLAPQGPIQLPSADPVVATTTVQAQATTNPPTTPATTAASTGNTNLPLSLGSSGSLVRYVQGRLEQLGDYNGSADGQYNQATAAAVAQFQNTARVQGDPSGVVGRSTMTALIAAGSEPNLKLNGHNDNSADVKRLQAALDYAENADLPDNGVYNAVTWEAVSRYQAAVGLPPTGQVDSKTWAKLQSGTLAN